MAEYRRRPSGRGHGSRRGEQPDGLGTGRHQRGRARPARRPGGQHVVDEHHAARRNGGLEHPPHGFAALGGPSAGLWTRVANTPEQRHRRGPDPGRDRVRERLGLVVPSGREPVPRQRNPGDGARRPGHVGPRLCHRGRERIRHRAPASELQPVDRAADRPVEPERRPGDRDGLGRTVSAGLPIARRRRAASPAPRGRQDDQLGTARGAERPRTGAAAGAPFGEQRIEQRAQHARTLALGADTRARATRCRPPPPRLVPVP